ALRASPWMRDLSPRATSLSNLEAAIRADPGDPLARYHLAKGYYLSGRFTEARDAYHEAVRLDPNSSRAHLGLALSLYQLGSIRESRGEREEASRLDPNASWTEFRLGKIDRLGGAGADGVAPLRR